MLTRYCKHVTFFIIILLNIYQPVYSSEQKNLRAIECKSIIICQYTKTLKINIACSKWDEVKKELLSQNELDIFARQSIKEIFRLIDTHSKNKLHANWAIRTELSQRLFTKDGNKVLPIKS